MSDYGFRVSKTGYDVKTATPDQLAVTSKLLSEKVALYGTQVSVITGTSTTVTITHNLGYVPQFKVWDLGGTNQNYIPVTYGDTLGNFTEYLVWATTTTLVIKVVSNAVLNTAIDVRYQLLYNSV